MSVKVTKLDGCCMIEDALEKSGCNFSVEQAEIINSANGSIIGDKKVLYRGDTGLNLGVVGKNYGILQNSEAFAFFDIIAQTQKAKITKAIQYNGGKKILLSAETDKLAFEPRKGEEIVVDLFENGKGNGKGTAWDLYNGVTEYVDHYSRYTKNVLDDEKTLEYSTIGVGSILKEKAMDLVLEM